MMQWYSSIRNLMLGRGIAPAFSAPFAISVYGGIKPPAATIANNWSAYNSDSTDFLAHYQGASWQQPSWGTILALSAIPAANNALHSGTGTWCILWTTNVTPAAVALTTLPNTQFIVADVSEFGGNGVIKFTSTVFTLGSPNSIVTGNINASST